jgi:predicted Zn finger-like uncharacterized protein
MPINVQCPGCGSRFRADDKLAGRRGKCPKCSTMIEVKSDQQQQPAQPHAAGASAAHTGPGESKQGNWRPGEKVPRTGTYKYIMCGPGGALMSTLGIATGLAGIEPAGLAASQPTSTRFFRQGELFTKCPDCAAIAADAGTTSDMTGWDFVSAEEVPSQQPTTAEQPHSVGSEVQGHCDVCNEYIVRSNAKVVTTAVLQQATRNGYCGKQSPFASAMGLDKQTAWQMTLTMGAATNWALCSSCAAEVESFLAKRPDPSVTTPATTKNADCFIATAACGDANAREVTALRAYRDRRLLRTCWGRWFVGTYYALSPPIARLLGRHRHLRGLVRATVIRPLGLLAEIGTGRPRPHSVKGVLTAAARLDQREIGHEFAEAEKGGINR